MTLIVPEINHFTPEETREEWDRLLDFSAWAIENYGCVIEPVSDSDAGRIIHEKHPDTPPENDAPETASH